MYVVVSYHRQSLAESGKDFRYLFQVYGLWTWCFLTCLTKQMNEKYQNINTAALVHTLHECTDTYFCMNKKLPYIQKIQTHILLHCRFFLLLFFFNLHEVK